MWNATQTWLGILSTLLKLQCGHRNTERRISIHLPLSCFCHRVATIRQQPLANLQPMNRMRLLDNLYQYDQRALWYFVHSPRRPHWVTAARAVSRSGDGLMQLLLPLLLWAVDPEPGLRLVQVVALAFAIERPLYWILKHTCRRRRPPDAIASFVAVIKASDQFSFPSGHTMGAFLLAVLVWDCYGATALPLFVWASAVGTSRVALGVHFPSDILAGAGIGIALGAALGPF